MGILFKVCMLGLVSLAAGCAYGPVHGDGRQPAGGYRPGPARPLPAHGGVSSFRCESNDNKQRYCRVDTRGGVRLVRQLSKNPCVRGRTWDTDRNGVWVAYGCRAEFEAGRVGNHGGGDRPDAAPARTLRCESSDNRHRLCPVSVGRGVQLTRQLSKTRCIQGGNWGWDRRGIWVDHGCRAEFSVY